MLIPRDSIAQWAAKYVGVPVVDGGRTVESGLDCWGLNHLLWQDLGLETPRFADLYIGGRGHRAIAAALASESRKWLKIEPGDELPGDGLSIRERGRPIHTAVVVQRGLMIHADAGFGSVTAPRYTSWQWRDKILGFYRHPEAQHAS